MPKQVLQVTNFAGGLNAYSDARDIEDTQFSQNWNALVGKSGIVRVAGMAEDYISTEYFDNTNFQKGHGLFQFTADYSLSGIDGTFSTGITTGTIATYASTSSFTLEDKTDTSSSNDYYNDFIIYIYSGTGKGESRKITDYIGSSRTVTSVAFATTLHDKDDATPSKYIIYRWTPSSNFLGDGTNNYDYIADDGNEDYSLVSKSGDVSTNTSNPLGYVDYEPKLSLTPGFEYTISFDCQSSTNGPEPRYYNAVSNGHEDGNTTNNYADKVPWIELYSTTVADTKGSIKTLSDLTPTSGEGNLSGNWEGERTNESVGQTNGTSGTSGQGTGALFNVIVDDSNNHTVRLIPSNAGTGYVVGDTLVLTDPGSTTNTITLTVATINMTGLSLVSSGTEGLSTDWLKGIDGDGTSSGYITKQDSNYIDNGDFRTTITTEWSLVAHDDGSAHGLTAAIGSTDESYDGLASSLKLTTSIAGIGGPGSGWISQTVTLDELTPYALNFVYSTKAPNGRAEFRVLGPDGTAIIGSEIQATTGVVTPSYRWANEQAGSGLASGTTNDFSYLQFKTPASITSASTVACKVQFRPVVSITTANYFFLHGVTLHKNYFDLSNMSLNNPEANNPFKGGLQNYSKYSVKFLVPDNYNSVSDWVFRIHAGKYGWIDNNTLDGGSENSQSLEINIKNIQINGSFETQEIVTLLMDNAAQKSSIFAYTSTSSSWIKDFLNFSGTNVKPVYNYINGMLKISDGNFSNSNENKLVYYSTRSIPGNNIFPNWIKRGSPIIAPPSLSISQNDDDNISSAVFDCNKHFNTYFTAADGTGEKFIGMSENGLSTEVTNWPLNTFGFISQRAPNSAGAINPSGLITRHLTPSGTAKSMPHGRTWKDGYDGNSEIDGYQTIYHPDSTWYNDTFINPMDDYLNEYYEGDDEGERAISDSEQLTNFGLTPPSTWTSNASVDNKRNPICLAIEPSFFSNIESFQNPPTPDNPIGNISYVDIKFKVEYVFWGGPYHYADYMTPPVFDFSIGILDGVQSGTDLKDSQIKGINMEFAPNKEIKMEIGDVARDPNQYNTGDGSIWKIASGASSANCGGFIERYDSTGKLVDIQIKRGKVTVDNDEEKHGLAFQGDNWKVIMDIEAKIEIDIDGLQIDVDNDILLIKLFEDVYHSGYTSGASGGLNNDGLLGITAGWSKYGNIGHWTETHYVQGSTSGFDTSGNNAMAEQKGQHTSYYSRYIIEKFDIGFYNEETDPVIELGSHSAGINLYFDSHDSEGVGWADRVFEIATTSVNVFGEESALSSSLGIVGEDNEGVSFIQAGHAPSVRFKMKESYLNDIFITKTKVYMRDTESETWYLQCYLDHKKRTFHSTTSFKSSDAGAINSLGEIEWFLERDNFKNFNEVASYESETMVSQDDGASNNKLTARYKTSTIANNRMYVGNVMQEGVIHGDRMLKSPIGKYNILPASSFVDVAINDGDEITALAYYKDKILQFKKRKVFVINISGDYEFLEDTFDNVGVLQQCAVVKTPYGIVWGNKSGCYLYNGSQMSNLIEDRLGTVAIDSRWTYNYWLVDSGALDGGITGAPVLGYIQEKDKLIVKWTASDVASIVGGAPDIISYHFPTKSWVFLFQASADVNTNHTGGISNIITNEDGDVLFYRVSTDTINDTSIYDGLKKWNDSPTKTDAVGLGKKYFSFITKDFTFGDIINRKKIYKVYVTYKTTDGSNSNVILDTTVNSGDLTGSTPFSASLSRFAGTSTACYHSSNGLLDTGGDWKVAELKFTTPSDYNNIYTFQLQLFSSLVDVGFEVNDISIVYKTKRTK